MVDFKLALFMSKAHKYEEHGTQAMRTKQTMAHNGLWAYALKIYAGPRQGQVRSKPSLLNLIKAHLQTSLSQALTI